MAILPGLRLGPYEILSSIGAGGMGEVYRAKDTRLDRIVAIKVLPPHLADSPELRERLEREARTIASLNHPHICTLHDIGHQDGTDFLVMEYLDGETLAQRLVKGPLPLEQVLQFAIEIADALDKAHRKGVTHRDLKPGNIMLTKSGTKLLDFGLAKLRQDATPASPLSQLPTANDPLTAQGTIVGTLQYMAPEQLEGKEVDARTDIFAFGAVVYEMATGKRAFDGKSQASLIAAILEREPPPMSTLQPMTPPAFDRVVKKCLAKEPDKRWQSASDVCDELKWIVEGGSQAGTPPPIVTQRKNRERFAWSIAAVLIVAAVALGTLGYFRRSSADKQLIRFFVSPPGMWSLREQLDTTGAGPAPLAVSPDGHRIAFVAVNAENKSQIWIRSLDALTSEALAETEGASRPFWSPDSRFLGFFAGGKLRKIDISGGPVITLCDAPDDRGASWSRDGLIIFAPALNSALQKVPAAGGTPTVATTLGQGEASHRMPSFLPDGRHFLYTVLAGPAVEIYLGSLDSNERKLLLKDVSQNVVYSDGYLLFLQETTLMARRFDLRHLELSGDAFPIAEQIRTQGAATPNGVFSASENGVLAYQAQGEVGGTQLVWFNRSGKQIGVAGASAKYGDVELSLDGKRASFSIPDQSGKGTDIWLYDMARGLGTRFTFDPPYDRSSIWSPDGSRLIFNSRRKDYLNLYQKSSNGAGREEALLEDQVNKYPSSWSQDGRFILYWTGSATEAGTQNLELFVLPLSGDRKPFRFLSTQFNELLGQFSPDARWVAYQSDESGKFEIYVASFPNPNRKSQISTGGGTSPRWRRDGTEIFYLAPDNRLMAAAVNGKGSTFEVGAVKPLFQTHAVAGLRSAYAVAPDGQQFLVNTLPEQTASAPITVVLNWTGGLKK